jgi:ribosome biogenesis protein Tsr3
MSKFKWGDNFFKINEEVFDLYINAEKETDLV